MAYSCMKIVHLLSNYKLTGPSEAVINLVKAQKEHAADVILASSQYTKGAGTNIVADTARERGIEPFLGLYLTKHRKPFYNAKDIYALARYLSGEGVDVIHCHMNNDHCIAHAARALSSGRPSLVRTLYMGDPPPRTLYNRILLNGPNTHLIVPSQTMKKALAIRYGFDEHSVHVVDPAIDTDRFDPDACGPDKREEFGLSPDDFVLGIVARVQWHRRFAELLEGVRIARQEVPHLRLLIVGRGTNVEKIAVEPARNMNLDTAVYFTGYQTGDNYVRTLKSFDAKIFLVPGTDGTCRAVVEALCMGKPVIAARRGILPDLIENGATGLVIDDSPENIAQAIKTMAADRQRCLKMGACARQRARQRFGLSAQAKRVLSIYDQCV